MKKYYTLAELRSLAHINVPTLFHELAQADIGEAFTFLSYKNNPKLDSDGGFVSITNNEIKKMEIEAYSGSTFFKLSILHSTHAIQDGIWRQYLTCEEIGQYINEKDIKKYEEYKPHMPQYYKDLSPIDRVKASKTARTEVSVGLNQIFVRSDSRTFKKITGLSGLPPHLDPKHPNCSERIKLYHKIIGFIADNKDCSLSHTQIVQQIMDKEGYDYKYGDEVFGHFSYITAENFNKHPMKKKK